MGVISATLGVMATLKSIAPLKVQIFKRTLFHLILVRFWLMEMQTFQGSHSLPLTP